MIWSGFAVLLIVPAAFLMICAAVILERCGLFPLLRQLMGKVRRNMGSQSEKHDEKHAGRVEADPRRGR